MLRWAAVCPAAWVAWVWTCNSGWASLRGSVGNTWGSAPRGVLSKEKTRMANSLAGFFFGAAVCAGALVSGGRFAVETHGEAVLAQVGEYVRHALFRRQRCRVDPQLWVGRGFIRRRHAGKRRNFSRPGFRIEAFRIAASARVDRRGEMGFDKFAGSDDLARHGPVFTHRRNERRDDDEARVVHQLGDVCDSANVFAPIFLFEAEVGRQAVADIVAIKDIARVP